MNYVAKPTDIDAFAATLSRDFGPRATTILNNVKNAELGYADFGPFLAGFCADLWWTNYNALLHHVSSIAENVQQAADRFHETAETYRSTDEDTRSQLVDLAEELHKARGTTLDAKSAPKDAPADGWAHDMSNSYYQKPGERTNYGDRMAKNPGFPGAVAKTVNDLMDLDDVDLKDVGKLLADGFGLYKTLANDLTAFASDPLGFLISNGLGFLINVFTPLKQLVDTVATGNPDALKAAASRFADIGKDLERFATDLVGAAQQGIPDWEGEAAVAAAAKLDAFVKGIHGTAAVAGGMAGTLQLIAMLSQALEDTVISILSDVIKWAILIWLKALAEEIPTAGASTVEAAAETELAVAQGTQKAAGVVEKAGSMFSRVGKAFNRMATVIRRNDTKFVEEIHGVKRPTLKGEAIKSGKDLIAPKKLGGYGKSLKAAYDGSSIGTDETDEQIDEQLDFGR